MFKGSRKKLRPAYSIVAAGIALLFAVAPSLDVTSADIGVHATTVEPLDPIQSDAPSSDPTQGAVGDSEPTAEPETTDEVTSETPSPEVSTESQTPSPSNESASPEEVLPTVEPETNSASPFSVSPLALEGQSCDYADEGSGAYAETLCWLDFTGFTTRYRTDWDGWSFSFVSRLDPEGGPYVHTVPGSSGLVGLERWGNVQNVPVEVELGDGFVLKAQLDTDSTGVATQSSSKAIESASFPTWQGAFLGRGFYSGVEGEPALYQAMDGRGTSTVTLKNIRVERNGQEMRDYSIVVADAETTDDGEGISWTTNGAGFRWLPNTPPGNTKDQVMGNACSTAEPAWDSTSTPQEALCEANNSSSKTGTPMLATEPPLNPATAFEISQTLSGNGRQGVAFGIIMARASVEVNVADRIVDAANAENDPTNFTATVRQDADSSLLMSAETGEQDMTSGTVSNVIPVSSDGTRVRYETARTGTFAESYTPAWQCEKTDPSTGATSYWPSETTTSPTPLPEQHAFSLLRVGEFLHCAVEYQPPYLSLLKTVENGETDATNTRADFTLHAEGNGSINSAISGPGNAATQLTRRPVAVGQYELSETGPDPDDEGNWPYGYDWSDLQCLPTQENGSINPDDVDITRDHLDIVTEANLQIHEDSDVTCTFTNTAREPRIAASKTAFDDSDTVLDWANPVDGGGTVRYRLTFDNVGTAPMELDHVDYLADVLDDANYVPGSLRIQNGDETSYPDTNMSDAGIEVAEQLTGDNPRLEIAGSVDRDETRTVWFEITVLDNTEDAADRQEESSRSGDDRPEQTGYSLNNYLVEAGEPVPETCEEPSDPAEATCTHQPIPAWSLGKSSRPADGARLHKGGNTHYEITATKRNSATDIDGLVFTDDLTHVFKTAGWAPGAAVPGGAKSRGIYFLDENGQTLDANGDVTSNQPTAAYDAESGYVPEPAYDTATGRWTITTLPVDVPASAKQAELWFAVEAGQTPEDIPAQWTGENTPQMGWRYTNYVTAQASNLAPNQCDTTTTASPNTGIAPGATTAYDPDFPDACRVTHQLSENYFTIRKDAGGVGVQPTPTDGTWGDTTGLTNMVGHEFEIRDNVNDEPSANPSERLCRTEYDPDQGWDGTFITGGTPDWGENSETLAAIIAHNNELEEDADPLPLCALFYPQGTYGGQDHAGGQDGRWRSEQLGEGDYWLVETKAPTEQINTDGSATREVSGVQLLAEPVAFTVWPDEPDEPFGETGQSMHGQGQLDIVGQEQERCMPGGGTLIAERPVACVNPTGYLMIVKDAAPMTLPLTGGQWLNILTGAGIVVLLGTLATAWWRKRNPKILNASDGNAGSQ